MVLFTLVVGLVFLDKNKQTSKIVLLILFISSVTEIIGFLLLRNYKDFYYLYSLYFIFHSGLWLLIVCKIFNKKNIYIVTIGFFVFAIINILLLEGPNLNQMTFVVGALCYISIFAIESYHQLKNENLNYFVTNTYLLLFAPILFFFGFSFLLSFRNSNVMHSLVLGKTDLYSFISYFANISYYSLINLYIYREYKLKND